MLSPRLGLSSGARSAELTVDAFTANSCVWNTAINTRRRYNVDARAAAVAQLAAPRPPTFSENFQVNTIEIDLTRNGTVTLQQLLMRDSTTLRNYMLSNGSLTDGWLEEVTRCDIHPYGWYAQAGGPNALPSSWLCQNSTILSDPLHCQLGTFWAPIPANASYAGQMVEDGRLSNYWKYWENGEQYAFWTATRSPLSGGNRQDRNGTHRMHLWRLIFATSCQRLRLRRLQRLPWVPVSARQAAAKSCFRRAVSSLASVVADIEHRLRN